MIRHRYQSMWWARLAVAVVASAIIVALIGSWLDLPGVPTDVTESAESEHVRILEEASVASPGNDWEDSYALLSVASDGGSLAHIEMALQSAGWSTHRGGVDPLLLSGDMPAGHPKYGVTVIDYAAFECLDRPKVCEEFKEAARGHGKNLFVATFMPYV
ncbi:hypothetical protein ACFSUJ_09320 [Streptomyces lusitanus]|uniref:Secreted protein n=1 Tax=Streptomyces lusitanus TaxID=68232 RepID=A0ABU3JJL3_9ACTN|nr:hypothetical protein [Streptomyces lusitanus]